VDSSVEVFCGGHLLPCLADIPDEIPATPKSAEAVVEIENVLNMRSDSST